MTFNSWSSCLPLPSARIIGMCHHAHAQFVCRWGLNPGLGVCSGKHSTNCYIPSKWLRAFWHYSFQSATDRWTDRQEIELARVAVKLDVPRKAFFLKKQIIFWGSQSTHYKKMNISTFISQDLIKFRTYSIPLPLLMRKEKLWDLRDAENNSFQIS